MVAKQLKEIIEKQIEKSTSFWAGRPEMTARELEAVEKFAKEKSKLFEKVFDSSEKVENIIKMQKNAL